MDDEIEILDELEVIKVVKNPIYKPKSKPISLLQKCRFCKLSFDNNKTLLVHCAFKHYKNYLEEEMKRFFKIPWDCSVCFDELNSGKEALLHVAISHKLGVFLVYMKQFPKGYLECQI